MTTQEETSSPFKEFAELCERLVSTTKKNEKASHAAEYLRRLNDDDLELAARFLSGEVFPKWDSRDVFAGYSIIADALLDVTGRHEDDLYRSYRRHGDLGSVAEELLSKRVVSPLLQRRLTLTDLFDVFLKMASAHGSGSISERRKLLSGLLLDTSPLEAKYLVKLLSRELRIGMMEGMVEEAVALAFDRNPDAVREAHLVIGDVGRTAILARFNRLEDASPAIFHPTNFMLADTLQSAEEIAEHFSRPILAEYKYDGVRAQLHASKGVGKIFSRRLEEITGSFPEIAMAAAQIRREVILDGEIIPFKDDRPLSFQELQKRLRRKKLLVEAVPVAYKAFDIIYLDGESLLDRPLSYRRRVMKELEMQPPLGLSHQSLVVTPQQISSAFEESKALGYEGLVVKDPDSPYRPGRRGSLWVKLKRELDTLDVVIVAAEYGHGKRVGVLSDYTFSVRDDSDLKVIGKAYSGLTDKEIAEMTERLKAITVRDEGFRRRVKPEIVLEVAFDNIQKSARHDSGYALRFPRIKRVRDDKSPDQIDTLDRVREIYLKQKSRAMTV